MLPRVQCEPRAYDRNVFSQRRLSRGGPLLRHERVRRFEADYELGPVLGEGSFGDVRLATHRVSGARVAVKVLSKRDTPARRFWPEVEALDELGGSAADSGAVVDAPPCKAASIATASNMRDIMKPHMSGDANEQGKRPSSTGVDKQEHPHTKHDAGHPAIARLLGTYESATEWYIVTELVEGGELFERIRRHGALCEHEAARAIQMVAEGLVHVHRKGYVHGDIKPENILIRTSTDDSALRNQSDDHGVAISSSCGDYHDCNSRVESGDAIAKGEGALEGANEDCGTPGTDTEHADVGNDMDMISGAKMTGVALIDFGNAFKRQAATDRSFGSRVHNGSGTIGYTAPELVAPGENSSKAEGKCEEDTDFNDGHPSPRSDVWALGVVMYIVLCGCHPFDPQNDADDDEVERRVLASEYSLEHCASYQLHRESLNRDKGLEGEVDTKAATQTAGGTGGISVEARDLLEQLLDRVPGKRPSAEQLLHHPWLLQNAVAAVEVKSPTACQANDCVEGENQGEAASELHGLLQELEELEERLGSI
eukprot:g1508.t1